MLQCERWGLNATQGCAGSRTFRAKIPQMQPKQPIQDTSTDRAARRHKRQKCSFHIAYCSFNSLTKSARLGTTMTTTANNNYKATNVMAINSVAPPTSLGTIGSIQTGSSSPPPPTAAAAGSPYVSRVRRKVAQEGRLSNPLSVSSSVSPLSSLAQSRPLMNRPVEPNTFDNELSAVHVGRQTEVLRSPEDSVSVRSLASAGVDDGDQMFALLQSSLAGPPPETRHRSSLSIIEEGNQIVMGALRSVQSLPSARQETRARPDMSHLPMEMQGSFIDGGAGPLISEDTPGAFRAQGRAFGEMPDWARGGPGQRVSDPNPRPRTLRIVTPEGSSFRLSAETLGQTRSKQSFGSIYSVVEAQLVKSQMELNFKMNAVSDLEDMKPAPAGLEVAQVTRAEKTIPEEEEHRNGNDRMWLKVMVAMVVLLSLILVVLVAVYLTKGDATSVEVAINIPQVDMFPLDGNLPLRDDLCTHTDFGTLEPILQCYCTEEIMNLSSDRLRAHNDLAQILLEEPVLALEPLAIDCSDPKDLALLWLLENEVLWLAPREELVRQYMLAVMFHSWDGLGWTDNSGWLSRDEGCSWLGITCNDEGRVIRVDLPNNSLSGTVPSQMGKLQDLQVINLSGNLGLTGTIPSSFKRLSSLEAMDVDGTSINT
jgi:hypothetical protein